MHSSLQRTAPWYTASAPDLNCDKSVLIAMSLEDAMKDRMLSHAVPASQCLAKYSHMISRSYLSIPLQYDSYYRYSAPSCGIMR